jgi:hypothetical protein
MKTTRPSAVLIGILFAIGGQACTDSLPGTAAPTDRPATIPLSTYIGPLRSMAVTVAGQARPFIFDTGGGETMVSPAIAAAIGCRPYGRAVGFRAGGDQIAFEYCDNVLLRFGDVAVAHERVGVFDLKAFLPADLPPAEGVVSLRSFRDRPVTIDLAKGSVTVETAATLAARIEGMRPLTIRVATGPTGAETTVYVGARMGGQRVWLLLDSGNGGPVLVAPHVAQGAGHREGDAEAAIEFDGLGPRRLPVATRPMIYDGVLNAAFMRDWIVTLDLGSHRAWATPAPVPVPVPVPK